MAFENVDVSSLKSAINSCKNAINYSGTQNVIDVISNDNNWNTLSRNTFKNALNGYINNEYSLLIKRLDNCLEAANYIEDYKELERENSGYQSQINQLTNKIKNAKYTKYVVQSGDTLAKIAKAHGVSVAMIMAVNNITNANKIYVGQSIKITQTDVSGISSEISRLENLINENVNQMENLKNKAYALF